MTVKWPLMEQAFERYLDSLFQKDSPLAGHEFGREILRVTFMAGAKAALGLVLEKETRRAAFEEVGAFGDYVHGDLREEWAARAAETRKKRKNEGTTDTQ